MMLNTPIDKSIVESETKKLGITNLATASIREIVGLVNNIQSASGQQFIRMEMGVPSLKAPQVGVDAEIEALKSGVASVYPMVEGVKELKEETSKFVKNFIGIDVSPKSCIPTVGSMQGSFASLLACANVDAKKDTVLFIDPGFPIQKQQLIVIGAKSVSFDLYDYRGEDLRAKIESYLSKGNISSILYSNPNNPSWVCFSDEELKMIGDLANKYDTIIIEDLAYFAMDFRKTGYHPACPPYQSSVANYTDNYILLISGSKALSYAGQRIAVVVISDTIFNRKYENLKSRFGNENFGVCFILKIIYALSAGVSHSAQCGLAAMFKAANEGKFDFIKEVQTYGNYAKIMKKLFLDSGFKIVYNKDLDQDIADGFYFTITYPGMNGSELLAELLNYGISAITLDETGSTKQGLRACVSQMTDDLIPILEERLDIFKKNHS